MSTLIRRSITNFKKTNQRPSQNLKIHNAFQKSSISLPHTTNLVSKSTSLPSTRSFCNKATKDIGIIGLGKNGQRIVKRILSTGVQDIKLHLCDQKPDKIQCFLDHNPSMFPHQPSLSTSIPALIQKKPSVLINAVSDKSFNSVRDILPQIYASSKPLFIEASEHVHPLLIKNAQEAFVLQFPVAETLEVAFSGVSLPNQPFSDQAFVGGPNCETIWNQHHLSEILPFSSIYFMDHFGGPQIAKLCVHNLTAINMAALSESISFSRKFGANPKIISNAAESWVADHYNPWPMINQHAPSSKTYLPGYSAHQMKKDLQILQNLATENEIPMVFLFPLSLNLSLYKKQSGYGKGNAFALF